MSIKKILIAAAAGLTLFLASCTTFAITDVAYFKQQPANAKVLGEFSVSVWVNQFLGASGGSKLFNLMADVSKDEIKKAIDAEIAKLGGDAAINVSVIQEAGFLEVLLNSVTGSIYAPVSLKISGTVVKF